MQRTGIIKFLVYMSTLLLTGCALFSTSEHTPGQNQVEIVAKGMKFDAPDSMPAGWTTFHFSNLSSMVHFAAIQRLPEGHDLADQQREVAPPFQEGMNLINAGKADEAMNAFGKLPKWFGEVEILGGPGLLSPGHTSSATVYLEPGNYYLECYVKTNGVFHSYSPNPNILPMVHAFTVSEATDTVPPEADIQVSISSTSGIQVDGDLTAGHHTVAVSFKDQKLHEHFLGHDVHLARIAGGTKPLAAWMNWASPTGLEVPAPAEFLGGLEEMPAGRVGYFSVDLKPGAYAWIAEVPDAQAKGMLVTTRIP